MLSTVPSPPSPTFKVQYLLYVNRTLRDGLAGLGITPGKHWNAPPHAQTPSSQTPFWTARVCAERCLGRLIAVECGSKGLGGCDFPYGESHIFLAPCDCRVVSLADCLACARLTREVSE